MEREVFYTGLKERSFSSSRNQNDFLSPSKPTKQKEVAAASLLLLDIRTILWYKTNNHYEPKQKRRQQRRQQYYNKTTMGCLLSCFEKLSGGGKASRTSNGKETELASQNGGGKSLSISRSMTAPTIEVKQGLEVSWLVGWLADWFQYMVHDVLFCLLVLSTNHVLSFCSSMRLFLFFDCLRALIIIM